VLVLDILFALSVLAGIGNRKADAEWKFFIDTARDRSASCDSITAKRRRPNMAKRMEVS